MSQFITLQIGQCGNQIGSAFWPLALHEYGIQTSSGGVNLLKTNRNRMKDKTDLSDAFHSFFHVPDSVDTSQLRNVSDLNAAKIKARAVLVDMEDSVVARYKGGPLKKLFDHTCMVTNHPGSGNNWAVGYYSHGIQFHDRLEETIRRSVELCDRLNGFLLLNSLGGGTGSGLGTATLKLLSDNYPCVDRLVSCIYPAGTEDVITAPYNVLLATNELIEHATCVFPTENRALLDICNEQMKQKNNMDQMKYNASCQPFQDMNSIVVNMLLHLTSGSRFPGHLNTDINDIATNLVPYQHLHFVCSSVSPVALTAPTIRITHGNRLQDELFTDVWSRNNQLIKVNPMQPNAVVLGAAYIARGDTSLNDLKRNIQRFQKKAKFTSWSKESIKIGMCSVPPAGHSASLLCLINSSAMSSMFKNIIEQFTNLYRKKAHTHHYTRVEGFEETRFLDSKETLMNLWEQYRQVENQKKALDIPRLQTI